MINEAVYPRRLVWSRRLVWLAGALALAACAALAPSRERLVLPLSVDPADQARRVAAVGRGADLVYLGEVHDNPHHHARQARVLEAMLADGARPALAFEMLAEAEQAAVEAAVAAAGTAPELDRLLGWTRRGWPDFAMYWPLFELAKRHRLRVVAMDLDPALARRIAREGLAAVNHRPSLASRLPPDPAREAAIARTIQEAHCDLLPERQLPAMVESWHARNVAMARRLAETLGLASPVVVIVGRGHQEAGGLPAQLEAVRPGTRQLVVDMREVGPGEAAGRAAREDAADIVWLTPPAERPDQCAELRRHLQRR